LIGGIEAKILLKMSQYFNFSYKIINCNYDWGILLPNKSWTGIIGKIVNKVKKIKSFNNFLNTNISKCSEIIILMPLKILFKELNSFIQRFLLLI
jgi:hypothetical protein